MSAARRIRRIHAMVRHLPAEAALFLCGVLCVTELLQITDPDLLVGIVIVDIPASCSVFLRIEVDAELSIRIGIGIIFLSVVNFGGILGFSSIFGGNACARPVCGSRCPCSSIGFIRAPVIIDHVFLIDDVFLFGFLRLFRLRSLFLRNSRVSVVDPLGLYIALVPVLEFYIEPLVPGTVSRL